MINGDMADPISITSGIAGLVSLAGTVLGTCYRFGCAVADAPGEAKRLASELRNLSGVLVGIQGIKNHDDGRITEHKLSQLLAECRQTLQDVSRHLDTVGARASQPVLKRNFNRLAWPLRRDKTLELVVLIERQKNSLSLALETLAT